MTIVKITYDKIYQIIEKIPYGCVATYGQIASLAGIPKQSRRIGYALSVLNDHDIPWHRVINAKGEISRRSNSDYESYQRDLLIDEGIVFDKKGKVSLDQFGWKLAKLS